MFLMFYDDDDQIGDRHCAATSKRAHLYTGPGTMHGEGWCMQRPLSYRVSADDQNVAVARVGPPRPFSRRSAGHRRAPTAKFTSFRLY